MTEEQGIGDWGKGVKASLPLPDGKGIIKVIREPVQIETKFGKRFTSEVVLDGSDGSTITIRLFLPAQFPLVHPKSNLAKIMRQYGCKDFSELIGKEVEVIEVGDMMWRFKVD